MHKEQARYRFYLQRLRRAQPIFNATYSVFRQSDKKTETLKVISMDLYSSKEVSFN